MPDISENLDPENLPSPQELKQKLDFFLRNKEFIAKTFEGIRISIKKTEGGEGFIVELFAPQFVYLGFGPVTYHCDNNLKIVGTIARDLDNRETVFGNSELPEDMSPMIHYFAAQLIAVLNKALS